jgi:hypothetical protein
MLFYLVGDGVKCVLRRLVLASSVADDPVQAFPNDKRAVLY